MTHRILVIGAGDWTTRHHLPALIADPRATVTTIVDADPDHAAAVAVRIGGARSGSDLSAMIATGAIDGALVATPHATHATIAAELLRAGIPVFVEKPLALRTADAIDLVEISESTGVLLLVGYTAQFTPAAAAAREWVGAEIGDLLQVVAEFSSRAGARYAGAAPTDDRSAYSAVSGGGQATTQLSHAVAAITSTTGRAFTEVVALTAARGTPVDVDDAVAFRLDGGVTGTAASTGALPADVPMRHVVRYLGSRGVVEHDLLWSTATLTSADGRSHRVAPGHLEPPYPAGAPVRAFLDLLDGGTANPAPVRPAAAAVTAIDAVLRSAASGRRETVTPIP